MPNLTLDVRALVTGDDVTGPYWEIRGHPAAASGARIGTIVESGYLIVDEVVEVATSVEGSYLSFNVPSEGVEWLFVMPNKDIKLSAVVDEFRPPVPVGPTPGKPGEPGPPGKPGAWYAFIYKVVAANAIPTSPPTGGTITPDSYSIAPPDTWELAPSEPGAQQTVIVSQTFVNPAENPEPYEPVWSTPYEAGGTGPTGPTGRGIKSITEAGDDLTVTLTDDTTQGPFTIPKGDKGDAGVGIKGIADQNNQLTVTLTDDSTEGPFTLPKGEPGDDGVGIKAIGENNNQLTVTLTDDSTEGPFNLPKGDKGDKGDPGNKGNPGDKGVGIKSITDTANQLTVTLTDDSTEGPFALPKGDKGDKGDPGSAGSLALTKVGNTIAIAAGATDTSVALTDLNEIIWIRCTRNNEGNAVLVRKDDLSTSRTVQIGNGTADILTYGESGANLSLTARVAMSVDVFNVTSGETGPVGPPGPGVPDGGTTGQPLVKKSNVNQDTEWGAVVDATVTTSAPVSGDGSAGDPVTIADEAIDADAIGTGAVTETKIGSAAVSANKLKTGAVVTTKIADNQVTSAKLIAGQRLPAITSGEEGYVVSAKADRSGYELKEGGGDEFTPTQANLFSSVKPMLEAQDQSSTIDPIVFTDDDTNHVVKMGVNREIIGEDWGNLPLNFSFRPGHIVPRLSRYYVCKKANQKGSSGPDNDPTNWSVITNWAGTWAAGWYDPGEVVLHSGELYTATVAVVNTDPAPDHADNTKWLAGGTEVKANQPLAGTEANLTSLEVDGTLYSLNVSEESAFKLTQISRTGYGIPSAASFGTVLKPDGTDLLDTDCDDVMLLELSYTRSNAKLRMSGLIRKAEIPVLTNPLPPFDDTYKFQLQGAGGDFASFFFYNDNSQIELRTRENSASVTTVIMGLFNVGGVKGDKGDKGDPGDVTQAGLYPGVAAITTDGDDGITYEFDPARHEIKPKLTLTQPLVYAAGKDISKAGDNMEIVKSDTDGTEVYNVRLPDFAAPNWYALDSRDVRTVQPPYSYNQIFTGYTLQPGSEHTVKGQPAVHDRDDDRPGFVNDINNGRRNANGKDFSNATAGTTTRSIRVSSEITLANERQYSSAETMTLRIYTYGHAKPSDATSDNHLTFTKVFNFKGGFQDAFVYDFDIDYTAAPRSGEHDGFRVTTEWNTGSGEVVAGIVDAYKETFTLPALGAIPTQAWAHHSAQTVSNFGNLVPQELKDQISSASRVLTWAVGTPNNTGRNAPNESDKADVTDPVWTFPNNVLDKPFLVAEQDLSRVKLHFAGGATGGAGDVYLCTEILGYPARVLANTSAASAWTLDYTLQGAVSGQRFYLIDPSGGGVGAPSATWDANPGGPKINNVIDGVVHTASLKAGINFTPGTTHVFTIDDDELNLAAQAGLLNAIRIFSNDVIGTIPLRGIPRPVPFGSGATDRVRLGHCRLKPAANSGGASTLTWVNAYRDINGMHFQLVGTDGTNVNPYVSGAEIEYEKYTTT